MRVARFFVCRDAQWYLGSEDISTLSQFVMEHGRGIAPSQDYYLSSGAGVRVNA